MERKLPYVLKLPCGQGPTVTLLNYRHGGVMSLLGSLLPGLFGGIGGILGGNAANKQAEKLARQQFEYQMALQNVLLQNAMQINQENTGEQAREFDTTQWNKLADVSRRNAMQSYAAPSMLYSLGWKTWDEMLPMLQRIGAPPDLEALGSAAAPRNSYYGWIGNLWDYQRPKGK